MKSDRKAWAAIPIGEPGKVVAVIYLDSARPEFFGKANGPRRKSLEFGAIGVARFVTNS